MQENDCRHERIITDENTGIVFIEREDPGSFTTKHWHESVEIIYITEGSTEVLIDQSVFKVTAGKCMVVNSGIVHSTRNMEGNRCILMQIPLEMINRHMPGEKTVYFDIPLDSDIPEICSYLAKIKTLIQRMKNTLSLKKDGYQFRFASLLYELLYQMYSHFGIDRMKVRLPVDVRKEGGRLKEVIDYTELHYREPIRIADAAQVIHLQPEYFCRYFKQRMGMTYLEYLGEVRLSYIYRDLVETALPLYQILDKHGFSNYKLFRKMFYTRFGCTPGQVRKERKI